MADRQQLKQALEEFQNAERILQRISQEEKEDWRLQLVQQRRAVALCLTQISTVLADLDQDPGQSVPESGDTRSKLSTFRAALATHQASFPAVTITRQDSAYRNSANAVRAASVDFCSHLRRTFELD